MRTLWQDLAYGLRMLRKSRGFAPIAVLTLGLGIGANTAIFSFVDAWLIKPLVYPQADRLMVLLSHDKKKGWTDNSVSSTADFFDFQKQNTSFAQTAAWAGADFNLTGDGPPTLVEGGRVSWNFFDTLGMKPMLGRTFTARDDAPGAAHVAVIAEGLWKSRYGSDPRIVGRQIAIGGESYAVVGVMPGTFQFPLLGIANLWTPMALTDADRNIRTKSWFSAFGRLKAGVTEEQAAAEAATIFARLEKQYPETNTNITTVLDTMINQIGQNEGTPEVLICFWIVGLILLIACANVANLMLARAAQRTKEIAVRGALGATKGRLVRQLLTESLLLFSFGGAAGVLFGAWGMSWIESLIPGRIRGYLVNYGYVRLDLVTLAFTLGIALLCGLAFGLAPAFQSAGMDLNLALKEASGQASRSGRGSRMRKIFVAAEIALAVVVLISTTLLVKSFIISVGSSPGFNAANVMTAQLELPKTKYAEEARMRNFSDDVLARIHAVPGVVSAGVASAVPFGGFGSTVEVEAMDRPAPRLGEVLGARFTAASPDYFPTMQIALIKGRMFTSADGPGNAPVTLISQTFAQQFWPGKDPIGQKLKFGDGHTICTIVGVVDEVKMYNLRGHAEREMYVPLAQFPSRTMGFVARTAGDPSGIGSAIRDSIWAVDGDQPVSSVEKLETLMAVQDAGNRVMMKLMVLFGLLALFLCAIGIYGVMVQTVAQRTREISIRMALGAEPGRVLRLVIAQGLKLALTGIVVGIAATFGTTGLLASQLYQVTTSDPLTFVGVPVAFTLIAAVACYVPARRAMRVDPMVALRYE